MIPIIEMLTTQPAARPRTKLRKFTGITIHDTGNPSPTADALAHAVLLINREGVDTSWHYSVDQGAIYRSIPEDEVAWHAGDGTNGPGNTETISIESCVNQGNDYSKTLDNMIDLCADILFRRGIKQADPYLSQHNHWTGKDCPHRIRAEGLWDSLKLSIQGALDSLQPTQNTQPTQEEPAMNIPATRYVVIDPDPQGIVRKDSPGMGPTHKVLGNVKQGFQFMADKLQVVDGYNWARGTDGWYPTGPADLSQIWIQVQLDTVELEALRRDQAALVVERDNERNEVNRLREIILDGPRKMDP